MRRTVPRLGIHSACLAAAALACTSTAQDERTADTRRNAPAIPREEIRDRLESKAEQLERLADDMRRAVELLDAGASLREAMGALPPAEEIVDMRLRGLERFDRDAWPLGEAGGGAGGDMLAGPAIDAPDEPTAADLEQLRGFIAEQVPILDAWLSRIAERDPDAEQRMLRRVAPRMLPLAELHEQDPALGTAKLQEVRAQFSVIGATRDVRRAQQRGEDARIDTATQELESTLGEYFDARVAVKRLEIERLEERVSRVEADLAEHLEQREQLIAEKLREITRREAGEGWLDRSRNRRPLGRRRDAD